MIPVAVFRDPEYPHGALFTEYPESLTWGQKVRANSGGTMLISRASVNASKLADLLQQGRPPMVTIEYTDGYTPFVGFVVTGTFRASDPHVSIAFMDHWWKLSLGVTKIAAAKATASNVLLGEILGEMFDRAAPPLTINLSHLKSGPGINREVRAEKGDSFVRAVGEATNFEPYFTYEITPGRVETFLEFTQLQGTTRRDIWHEGQQLSDIQLSYDFNKGLNAVQQIGGTGAFANRPTALATISKRPFGGAGTVTQIDQKITDKAILLQKAQAALDAPENVVRQLSAQLVETTAVRATLGVGDIRQFRMQTAFLSVPVDFKGRIVAIGFHPDAGVHDLEVVEQ